MILETIRKTIDRKGESRYAIAKACGIDQAVMSRIYHGGSCSVQTADRLCEHLGLKLVPKTSKRKGR